MKNSAMCHGQTRCLGTMLGLCQILNVRITAESAPQAKATLWKHIDGWTNPLQLGPSEKPLLWFWHGQVKLATTDGIYGQQMGEGISQ